MLRMTRRRTVSSSGAPVSAGHQTSTPSGGAGISALSADDRPGGIDGRLVDPQRLLDERRDRRPGGDRRDAHGVADHPPRGAPVGDEDRALDAQQRRAAEALVVEAIADAADAGLHEEVAERAPGRAAELVAQCREDEAREALEELDGHVADRCVADDDVGEVGDEVLALDVADEAQVAGRDEHRRVLDPLLPLATLFADREQGHGRLVNAEHLLAEDRPHACVLREVVAGRVGRGPDVEEHEGPLVGDHLDGQRRAVHPGQATQAEDGGSHAGARVASRHDRVRPTLAHESHADVDAGVALATDGGGGLLLHPDVLRGVHDLDVRRRPPVQRGVHPGGVADEDEIGLRVGHGPGQAALDDLDGRVVAAHGVDGHADARGARLVAVADRGDVHVLWELGPATRRSTPSWP